MKCFSVGWCRTPPNRLGPDKKIISSFFHFSGAMASSKEKWCVENMSIAISKVMNNTMSIREASRRFQVPKSTLADKLKLLKSGKEISAYHGLDNKGRFQRTFNNEQEEELHMYVKKLDNELMPLNKDEFLRLAFQLAEKLKIKHRFNKEKKMAGKDFYYDFMKRYSDLSLRTPESTSLQRAQGFNKVRVDKFFKKLGDLMENFSFPASRIFNCDETGVSVVHNNHLKVLSVKGKKQVGKLTSGERGKNITVLLCINAAGDHFIPPLFVFPRVRMDFELTKDAPEGSTFDAQPSGWITKEGFLKWMESFIVRVNPTQDKPVLLIVDGHSSHKDLDVILLAKKNHVHMLSLPPHTTHKLQPLDRSVMKPFKNAYNEACTNWMRKYPKMKISVSDVAGLVRYEYAFTKISRMELAQSAFACTGIYPYNANIFTDLDYSEPSMVGSSDIENGTINLDVDEPAEVATLKEIQSGGTSQSVSTKLSSVPTASQSTKPSVHEERDSSFINLNLTTSPNLNSTSLVENEHSQTPNSFLEEIMPLPSMVNSSFEKRKSDESEILTSTPYKKMLEEKKNKNHQKDLRKIEKEKRKTKVAKRSLNFKKQSVNIEKYGDEKADCIICGMDDSEDWIKCSVCGGWAHEKCADLEGQALYYRCDLCQL